MEKEIEEAMGRSLFVRRGRNNRLFSRFIDKEIFNDTEVESKK